MFNKKNEGNDWNLLLCGWWMHEFLLWTRYYTRLISKWSKADMSSEFFFSYTGCLSKAKRIQSALQFTPTRRAEWIDSWLYPRILVQSKKKKEKKPWTRFEFWLPIPFLTKITVILSRNMNFRFLYNFFVYYHWQFFRTIFWTSTLYFCFWCLLFCTVLEVASKVSGDIEQLKLGRWKITLVKIINNNDYSK